MGNLYLSFHVSTISVTSTIISIDWPRRFCIFVTFYCFFIYLFFYLFIFFFFHFFFHLFVSSKFVSVAEKKFFSDKGVNEQFFLIVCARFSSLTKRKENEEGKKGSGARLSFQQSYKLQIYCQVTR